MSSLNSTYPYEDDPEKLKELMNKLEQYIRNRALDLNTTIILIIMSAIILSVATIGNVLICVMVTRNRKMWTSTNLFILNLALNHLLLCFFAFPFSMVELMVKFWPFGTTTCKMVAAMETTSIYVSAITITAIALDRNGMLSSGDNILISVLILIFIWIMATLLALPLFLYRTVETKELNLPWSKSVNYCVERWPIVNGRGYYSITSMVLQYCLPISIVAFVYIRYKSKWRTTRHTSSTQMPKIKNRLRRRTRKTYLLLILIALIFWISWLPYSLLNIISDFQFPFDTDFTFRIVLAISYMSGMASACSNPLLLIRYNYNFRKEFKDFYTYFTKCFRNNTNTDSRNDAIEEEQHELRVEPNVVFEPPVTNNPLELR